jgi:hypothetical protein
MFRFSESPRVFLEKPGAQKTLQTMKNATKILQFSGIRIVFYLRVRDLICVPDSQPRDETLYFSECYCS